MPLFRIISSGIEGISVVLDLKGPSFSVVIESKDITDVFRGSKDVTNVVIGFNDVTTGVSVVNLSFISSSDPNPLDSATFSLGKASIVSSKLPSSLSRFALSSLLILGSFSDVDVSSPEIVMDIHERI